MVLSSNLKPGEVDEVRGWLSELESEMFFAQPEYDQRHGLDAARYLARHQPFQTELTRAALLHDVGKRHANLGPIGRSLASVHAKLGGTADGKWRQYIEHGSVGSAELASLGAEPIVVEFAMHHHRERPGSIPQADWDLLQAADGSRRNPKGGRRRWEGVGKEKPSGR